MAMNFTWRIGRTFGVGLFLADTLDEAVAQIGPICAACGYRPGDVHVWRDDTYPAFWVSRPGGQGGIGASSIEEAARLRDRLSYAMGVLVIRREGRTRPVTRGEARKMAS